MAEAMARAELVAWLAAFRDAVHEHREHLTALDSAIGDADHGTNLTRGMDAVMAVIEADGSPETPGGLLKATGMKLVSTVGGASGPLYGTFFLRAATAAGESEALDGPQLVAMLQAGVDGLAARGKAELGDKTMVDAFAPAVAAFTTSIEAGGDLAEALRTAATAAAQGRDDTTQLQARKGRASYLGERSIGHTDPGATSATLLLEALADSVA